MSAAGLNVAPVRLVPIDGIGQQNFLVSVALTVASSRSVVRLARNKFLGSELVDVAAFQRHKIEQGCLGVKRGGVPVRGSDHAWTDPSTFFRWFEPGSNGAAFFVNSVGPIQLLGKARCRQKLSIAP